MSRLAIGAAVAAALAFFFDPTSGRRRRAQLVQRTGAFFRRRARGARRTGEAVGAHASGVAQKATHLREQPKDFTDPTLKSKVESELFRDVDVPKGQIDVNVQDGVVQLRGEVPRPELIDELVSRVRKINGVREVESLLHLPGAQAPMHQ